MLIQRAISFSGSRATPRLPGPRGRRATKPPSKAPVVLTATVLTVLALALAGCGAGGASTIASGAPGPPPGAPGSKAPAPGVPTSRDGDNSIQTWGVEAGASAHARATALVRAYLDARAKRDWRRACSLLAARPRDEQNRIARGSGCAAAMAAFAAGAPASALREEARIHVLSFRSGRRYAFLIYRRPDGIWATGLAREGGRWKVLSLTPEPIG